MALSVASRVRLDVSGDLDANMDESLTRTASGTEAHSTIQSVATAGELLSVGDVAAPYQVAVQNLDATNYVEIFKESGFTNLLSKLNAGETCFLNRPDAGLYIRANTAACRCKVVAVEI